MITSIEMEPITEVMHKNSLVKHTNDVNVYPLLCEVIQMGPAEENLIQKSEELFTQCSEGMEDDSAKLLATLFLKALNRKMDSAVISENIYQYISGISQIELFEILIAKFPFVKYSQQLVNDSIVKDMMGQKIVTLMDIGIGLGTQMMHVIEKAKSLPELEKLIVVGLEPFADALAAAENNINELKKSVPFQLEFIPVLDYAEKFDFKSLNCVEGRFIINASLALHHIKTMEERKATLQNMGALNPTSIYMIEPNVNHYEPDFYSRFKNSWHHFYALFQVIDKLDITNDQKNGLKLFFGREIEDIIGKQETDRFEKHMLAAEWIQLLKSTQFEIQNSMLHRPFTAKPGVQIASHPQGFIGFTFENETALALIHAGKSF